MRAVVLVATWVALRALGGLDSVGMLAATAVLGLLAPWLVFGAAARQHARLNWPPLRTLALGGVLGGVVVGAAIATAWALGDNTGENWALRVGLQLGWWTDRLPFLPGKLLAVLVIALVSALVVVPEELLLRGVALGASDQRLTPLRVLSIQVGLTMLAATGDLWLGPVPAVVWAVHLLVAGAVAVGGTWLTRSSGSVLPAIVLHTAVRAVLVLHAFAWIPRLYR